MKLRKYLFIFKNQYTLYISKYTLIYYLIKYITHMFNIYLVT